MTTTRTTAKRRKGKSLTPAKAGMAADSTVHEDEIEPKRPGISPLAYDDDGSDEPNSGTVAFFWRLRWLTQAITPSQRCHSC